MIRLLMELAVFGIIIYAIKGFMGGDEKPKVEERPARQQAAAPLVEDPSCGVYLPVEQAIPGPDGKFFCSAECLEAYKRKHS